MAEMGLLRAYAIVSRLEYMPAAALLALLAFLLLPSPPALDALTLEAVLAFFLLYTSGFAVNALADREVDRTYGGAKSRIPQAIERLGNGAVVTTAATSVLTALLLSFHLAILRNQPLLLVLPVFGILFGIGYSVRPLQFKIRGVGHALALSLSAFFLPLAFLVLAAGGSITPTLALVLLGFTIAQYGLEFGNQAKDAVQDRLAALRTPAVRWSVPTVAALGIALLAIGVSMLSGGLSLLAMEQGRLAAFNPRLVTPWLALPVAVLLLLAYVQPIRVLAKIRSASRQGLPIPDARHHAWQAGGALGAVVATALVTLAPLAVPILAPGGPTLPVEISPIVEIGGDEERYWNMGTTLQVTPERIVDPDGEQADLSPTWYINSIPPDGTGIFVERQNLAHNFTAKGLYLVELVVVDGDQLETRDSFTIHVYEPLHIQEAVGSFDPDGVQSRLVVNVTVINDMTERKAEDLTVQLTPSVGTKLVMGEQHLDVPLARGAEWKATIIVDLLAPQALEAQLYLGAEPVPPPEPVTVQF